MSDAQRDQHPPDRDGLEKTVAEKEDRRLKARRERPHSVWFGLGMFGLVGWSVAIPALAGLAIGVWLDARWPSRVSWTLTLLRSADRVLPTVGV